MRLQQLLLRAAAGWQQQPSLLSAVAAACPSALVQLLQAQQAVQLQPVRCAGSRSGRRQFKHVSGYERLLQQAKAAHHKQPSGKQQQGRDRRGGGGSQAWHEPGGRGRGTPTWASQQRPGRRRQRGGSSSGDAWGSWQLWSDVGSAEAAASARLHPDELHNLVFGRGVDPWGSSSSSSSGRAARKARREQRRARRSRRRGPAAGAPGGSGFAFAEASGFYWESDDDSDEDAAWGGDGAQWHAQQGCEWPGGRPDWQWWTEEQERQWFEQAWQQQQQHGGRQQQARGRQSSQGRPWWESYSQHTHQQQQQRQQQQQHHQQQRQQQQQQQRQGAGASAPHHPPSVREHLNVLGLPASTVLQRAQLKAAFHKAAMAFHPDMHSGADAKAAAEARFKRAKESYEQLLGMARA